MTMRLRENICVCYGHDLTCAQDEKFLRGLPFATLAKPKID
jgi:hypothetical protein